MSTAERVTSHLEARGFKKHGNEWRGNSPLRPDSDSGAFAVTIDGPENGAWFDHARNEGGSLYELAEKLGIERPTGPTPIADTKRAYKDLADYARAHGVDAAVFEAAGWTQTIEGGRPALAFKTKNGTRYRYLDAGKPPYKSPAGYESCWYGLTRAADMAVKTGAPMVLVNGEASVVVAQHYGIPAAAVTSGGERTLSDGLLKDLRNAYAGKIAIAFDCDEKGRQASKDLAAQLTGYDVAVVDLGLSDKGDVADWCALHTKDALPRLMDRADFTAIAGGRKPSMMRSSDLFKTGDARKVALKSGAARLWLPTGYSEWDSQLGGGMWMGLNFIAGGTKMGKSTLCNSLVGRWTMLGLRGYIVTTEMPAELWQDRVVAAMARVNALDVMLGNVSPAATNDYMTARRKLNEVDHYWATSAEPTVASIVDDVLALASDKEIDFVIIDSMSNMRAAGVAGSIYDQSKAVSNQLNGLSLMAHKARGQMEPLPFVVTLQNNSAKVVDRASKIATLLDSYGGQSAGFDGSTYTTVNYHHWYVTKHLADPNPEWPEGVSALNVDAVRYGAGGNGKLIRMRYVPGMGFYDDKVPPPPDEQRTRKNGHVAEPRQYKEPKIEDVPF